MQKFKSGDIVHYQSAPVEVIAAKKDFKTNRCSYIILTADGRKTVNESELLTYDEFMEVIKSGENELDKELAKLTGENTPNDFLPIEEETYELHEEEEETEEEEEEEGQITDATNSPIPPVRRRGSK